METGAEPLRDIKVLVVDDDEVARDMLKVTLDKYGAEVMTAAAPDALDTLALKEWMCWFRTSPCLIWAVMNCWRGHGSAKSISRPLR